MMTNGFGAIIGALGSGMIIKTFFIQANGEKDWQGIWLTFSIYTLVVTIAFALLFKHKHNPDAIPEVNH